MEIGRKILNLRKDRGVAQRSLAHETDVTPSALSRIEAGIHQPRGPVAFRVSRRLGVTADYLLDDTAPYPPPAHQLLENLTDASEDEPRTRTVKVSDRERRALEALRKLDAERRTLLEATLGADRKTVRRATWLLGTEPPGHDEAEAKQFREMKP